MGNSAPGKGYLTEADELVFLLEEVPRKLRKLFDADAECEAIAKRGGNYVQKCQTFPKVARYGFIADPDGNWIEISARASLTGIMPRED